MEQGQCENCNKMYDLDEEVLGGLSGKCGYCSIDCKLDVDEKIEWYRYESKHSGISDFDYSMNY